MVRLSRTPSRTRDQNRTSIHRDTRRAILEARRGGARVFGITIDGRSQTFFPTLFGRGGYAVVNDPARLPTMMPVLLKHVMAG